MRVETGMRSAPARVGHRQKVALSGLLSPWTRWLGEMLAACERDRTALAEDGPASPGNGSHGLALGVVMVLLGVKRRLTPFWTVTDNPTPFAVNDPITPPDTD